MSNTGFKIVVPLYNVATWIKNCIDSVKCQNYPHYECVFIDDCSTDESLKIIQQETEGDARFKIIVNKKKKYPLQNICEGISALKPKDDDAIVILDGDDWLAHEKVLSILNSVYSSANVWMTYGSYEEYPAGKKGHYAKQVPPEVIKNNTFREESWMTSHLKTFRYGLFSKIDRADFMDNNGQYFTMAGDLALMYPMLEMAAFKSKFIEDILYVYNRSNPLNDDKVKHSLQLETGKHIRAKDKYHPISRSCEQFLK